MSKLSDVAWEAVFEEVRSSSLKILKDSGQESYDELRPFMENIAKWSADMALLAAQDDPGVEQARAMIISQLEMIAVHLTHESRKAFYAMVEKDLLIVARVLGTILKAAIA